MIKSLATGHGFCLQLLSLPRNQAVGLKVSVLYSWVAPLATNPPCLGAFQKSLHQHKPSCVGKGPTINNKTPMSPPWPEVVSGTEDKRPNATKEAPVALSLRKSQVFGEP